MSGRLAIDFGTCNTVVAVWDEARHAGVPLAVPEYARRCPAEPDGVAVIPSLIHYVDEQQTLVGQQVLDAGCEESASTFRWMKSAIAHRSPSAVRVGGRQISRADAGRDFLQAVVRAAARAAAAGEAEEVAFTVPVEAFEHYADWLARVAEAAGKPRWRLLDEPTAAALGYGAQVQPGSVYLVVDFGGGTLDAAVVRMDAIDSAAAGPGCRVLGKAGLDLGGTLIDRWLFEEVLRRNGRCEADEDVRLLSRALLGECEWAKMRLSDHERAEVGVMSPTSGGLLGAELSRAELEDLLDQHDLFAQLDRTLRRALNAARERGFTEDDVQAVLMVGGSSRIPSVQRTVQRIFGRERVKLSCPLDAVARGAAAFVAGIDLFDHIQHDYAIRFWDLAQSRYGYRTLVTHGTPYPSAEPLARCVVEATGEGQTQLGIFIFELGDRGAGQAQRSELVFDPSGAARLVPITPEEEERRTCFWMNEASPTFLTAEPPARAGEPRFDLEFRLDASKRLILTARDRRTGQLTHRDYPVVKLA